MFHYLVRYIISIVLISAIWVLCLIPVPETPLNDISFIDKWTHFIMYGSLSAVIWFEYARKHRSDSSVNWARLILLGTCAPALMGGLVELAQAYLTTCRSGDWFDALCNALGAILGSLVGLLFIRLYRK